METKEYKQILKLIHLGLLIGLLVLLVLILQPFVNPLLWSLIFSIFLHPTFKLLEKNINNNSKLAALLITFGGFIFLVLAVIPLFSHLGKEAIQAYKAAENISQDDIERWSNQLSHIPIFGPGVYSFLTDTFNGDLTQVGNLIKPYQSSYLSFIKTTLGNIASLFFNAFFTFLSLYFLLANSETLIGQIRKGASLIGGPTYLNIVTYVYETTRATLYGVLLTSFAQGTLAGFAYYFVSAPYPVTLSILTALASFIPFGPPFIYIPVALGLLATGTSWIKVLAFLIWGVLVVSMADNVLRPMFISHNTKLSFLLVLFGILGGVASFGMLGIFLGPITMVIVIHFWNELLRKESNSQFNT